MSLFEREVWVIERRDPENGTCVRGVFSDREKALAADLLPHGSLWQWEEYPDGTLAVFDKTHGHAGYEYSLEVYTVNQPVVDEEVDTEEAVCGTP